MRLLPILLLCSYCLLGSATIIDDDCNDQNVFSAVDEALRSFNNAKEDGNQFILYRITDAKIQNVEDGQIHHFVEYETHEGSCEVKSGKSWQECLSTYSHQVKCSAHVLFNKDLKVRSVESQNCSSPKATEWPPVTAVHYPCVGCLQPIDKENKELLCFVHSNIEQVNRDANYPLYFDLESIVNATRQVTYGWQYNIHFLIRQTNCSKSHFTSINSKECKIEKEGDSIECSSQVFVSPDGTAHYPLLKCKSDTGVCINCPVVIDPKNPELRALLGQVMDEYNFNSNHTKLYDVTYVEHAIKKGFQRELYEISYTIAPTNCSKPDYSILGDECVVMQGSHHLRCNAKINITDKTINVHSAPHCSPLVSFAIRIGGLSPLRSSRDINDKDNNKNCMLKLLKPERPRQRRHVHNNKGHKHGNKEKKDKERKNKHKYQHEDSSEEENEVTQAPLQLTKSAIQPEMSHNQEIPLNTDVAPRCPGRVWQPISLIPSIPTVKIFSIDDLVLTADDLTPSSEDIKNNVPHTPKQNLVFNDEDLLG